MRHPAQIAVLDTRQFEKTHANQMVRVASNAIDMILGIVEK